MTEQVCDDVDEYGDLFDGWTHQTIQTEPGRFGYKGHSIKLSGLDIHIDRHSRSLRWCEFPHSPVTSIFVPLKCSGSMMWRGQDLSADSIILQGKGEEQHFVVGPQMQAIFIDIDAQLVCDLGWDRLKNGHLDVAKGTRERLVRYCFDLIGNQHRHATASQLLFSRNALLQRLGDMLLSPSARKSDSSGVWLRQTDFDILLRCEKIIRETGAQRLVTNTELAATIGISERQLYRVFENQIGMSPTRYAELLRLHALRRYLQSDSHNGGRIADTMTKFGFTNAGRTARRYSDLFHEYPKETASKPRRSISAMV